MGVLAMSDGPSPKSNTSRLRRPSNDPVRAPDEFGVARSTNVAQFIGDAIQVQLVITAAHTDPKSTAKVDECRRDPRAFAALSAIPAHDADVRSAYPHPAPVTRQTMKPHDVNVRTMGDNPGRPIQLVARKAESRIVPAGTRRTNQSRGRNRSTAEFVKLAADSACIR